MPPTPESIAKMDALIASGYAGILPDGKIVDRREHPTAIPMQKNAMMGIPEPEK